MVAVGDDQLLVAHRANDQPERMRIRDPGEAMQNPVVVGDLDLRLEVLEEDLFDALRRVGVEHEDLAEVRAGGLQQIQTVALRLGERLLVTKDNLGRVVLQASERDESPAFPHSSAARNLKALRVGKDRGFIVGLQRALLAPFPEVSCGAGINIVDSRLIKQFGQAEDDAHQVIGAATVIDLLHRRRDLVIGLSDHVFDANSGGIVARGAEGIDACHQFWRLY